jgi:hypothetical protein
MAILTKDRIYFLLKDPYWSFIWWQIDWTKAINAMIGIEGRGAAAEPGIPVIRIHDVTDIIFDGQNSHSYVEIDGIYATDHWYFQIPSAGRNYCAEIGLKKGGLLVRARSNTLFVPRSGPSQFT